MIETCSGQAAPAPCVKGSGVALRLYRAACAAFVLDLLVVGIRLLAPGWLPAGPQIPEATLVLLGAATAAGFFLLELPAQNVLLAVAVIVALSVGADQVSVAVGSPRVGQNSGGAAAFVTWWLPLVRVFAILTSRGIARLVLRRSRPKPNYGFGVLGLTVALALGLELALRACVQIPEPYWRIGAVVPLRGWYGTSWPAIAGWAFALLAITALITPSLIDKRRARPEIQGGPSSNWLVWYGTNLLLLSAAVKNGLWTGASLIALLALAPGTLLIFLGRQFHH